MKKDSRAKLKLHRETVVVLNDNEKLEKVQGAGAVTFDEKCWTR